MFNDVKTAIKRKKEEVLRMRLKNIAEVAVTTAIAAGIVVGASAPAMAFGFGSPGFNSPGLALPQSNSEKHKLGSIGDAIWSADVYSQVVRGQKVHTGRTVIVRIEVVGTKGTAKLRQVGHNMPKDFTLKSVTRQSASNLFGAGIYTLKPDEYTTTERNGMKETRLTWTEGGFLGYFQDNPTVTTQKSVTVEFTYTAPDYQSSFDHGGYASIGAIFNPSDNWVVGGEKIVVENTPETAWRF